VHNVPMVRVLHVLEALEGGSARHVVDLTRSARGVDHEVVLPWKRVGAATDPLAARSMVAAGAVLHRLDMRRDPVRPANAASLLRLVGVIRQRRPDVVHAHSSIGGLLGRLAAAATRVPCVYTPHALTDVRAGLLVERALGPLTATLVAVSESERAHVLALGLVTPERVVVIPNGIEAEAPPRPLAPLDLRADLGLTADSLLVGSISRLVPQKAPDVLVAAWAEVGRAVPEAHFVLIGSGPLQDVFDDAVRRCGLSDRVHQYPLLPDAWAVLDQLEVFTLASRFEGAPYSLLEAIRAGVPIAATDVVGTRDVIDHRSTGLLAPSEDGPALGRLVVELLRDEELRATTTKAARERLLREFTVDAMANGLIAAYSHVTKAHPT
jgi:glycosyltransferase involved in cell wall biosynthesis